MRSDRFLHQIEHGAQVRDRRAHRPMQDQTLQRQKQEVEQWGDGDVGANGPGFAAALQPLTSCGRNGALTATPELGESGVRTNPAGDLSPRAQPIRIALGKLAHHLDETVAGHDAGHLGEVLLGEGEEERLLVAEVVKDRTAGEADVDLEETHCRALVAVAGEAGAGTIEDLTPTRVEMGLTDLRHSSIIETVRTYCNRPGAGSRVSQARDARDHEET